jgi:hypothetical protein
MSTWGQSILETKPGHVLKSDPFWGWKLASGGQKLDPSFFEVAAGTLWRDTKSNIPSAPRARKTKSEVQEAQVLDWWAQLGSKHVGKASTKHASSHSKEEVDFTLSSADSKTVPEVPAVSEVLAVDSIQLQPTECLHCRPMNLVWPPSTLCQIHFLLNSQL